MALNKAYEESEEADLGDTYREVVPEINAAAQAVDQMALSTEEVVKSQTAIDSSFDRLKSRIAMIFSLGTAYNSVRRVINQTFSDVTNIDKAFTEIAMVTSYSVQQMWGTYDQYAEIANELGQTTESVIRASSLYYQQGLQTNEAIQLATDTMKLATLAGLDFEQATSLMTAALRGFHMEMNQGAHVTDVYSELAAKAAASVNDIAQAMSRTASIANSAGMSFENTSAMLTTMIEATQESPENLGTAMKTIIARFTELKENVSATESEFDDLDYNKVDKALKSIGVSLKDANGQFRNIDEVLLETAEKWNTLDRNSQRYIATISAGSRQQSRFIALMENYERTMELVNVAQDSAGRSSEQFAKYQDSIENKVNRLKNTWEQLRLSFLSSDFYKNMLDNANQALSKISSLDSKQMAALAILGATIGRALFNSISKTIQEGLSNSVGQFKQSSANLVDSIRQTKYGKIEAKTDEKIKTNAMESALASSRMKEITAEIEKQNQELNKQGAKQKELSTEIQEQKIIRDHITDSSSQEYLKTQEEITALETQYSALQKSNAERQEAISLQEKELQKESQIYDKLQAEGLELQKKKANAHRNANRAADPALTGAISQTISTSLISAVTVGLTTAMADGDSAQIFKNFGITLASTLIPQVTAIYLPKIIEKIMESGAIKAIGAALAGPAGIGALITVAVPIIAKVIYDQFFNETKIFERQLKARKEALQKSSTELKTLADVANRTEEESKNLTELKKKYQELSNIKYKTTEQQEEYNSLIEELKTNYPELVEVVDEETNQYKLQNQLLDEKLQKINKLKQEQETQVLGASLQTIELQAQVSRDELKTKRSELGTERARAEAEFLSSTSMRAYSDLSYDMYAQYRKDQIEGTTVVADYLKDKYGANAAEINQRLVVLKETYDNFDKLFEQTEQTLENLREKEKKYDDEAIQIEQDRIDNIKNAQIDYATSVYGVSTDIAEAITTNIIKDVELTEKEFKKIKDDLATKEIIRAQYSGDDFDTWYKDAKNSDLVRIYNQAVMGQNLADILNERLTTLSDKDIDDYREKIQEINTLTYEELLKWDSSKINPVLRNSLDAMVEDTKAQIEKSFDDEGINFSKVFGIDKDTASLKDIELLNSTITKITDTVGEQGATNFVQGFIKAATDAGISSNDLLQVFGIIDFSNVTLDKIDQFKQNTIEALEAIGYSGDNIKQLVEDVEDLNVQAGIFYNYFNNDLAVDQFTSAIEERIDKVNESWSFFSQAFGATGSTFAGTTDTISQLEQFITAMTEIGVTNLGNPEDYYEIDKRTGEILFNTEAIKKLNKDNTIELINQGREFKKNTEEQRKALELKIRDLEVRRDSHYKPAFTDEDAKQLELYKSQLEALEIDYTSFNKTLNKYEDSLNGLYNSVDNMDLKVDTLTKTFSSLTSTFKSAYSEMNELGHISASTIASLDENIQSLNSYLGNSNIHLKTTKDFLIQTNNGIQLNTASLEEYIFAALAAAESDKELSQAKQILYYQLLAEVQAFRDTSNEIHQQSLEEINKLQEDLNSKLEAEAQARETLAEKIEAQAEAERKLYEAQYGTANHKNKLDSLYNYQTYLQQSQDTQKRAQDAISRGENIPANLRTYMEAAHQEIVNYEAQNQLIQQHIANQRAVLDSRLAEELRKLRDSGAADMSINVSDFYKEINGRWVIDFEKLNAANIPDEISDYIESVVEDMNNYARTIEQNIDAIKQKEQELKEFQSKARQDYLNVVNKVAEVLKAKYEEEIKDVQDKYTAIKEADQDYLDALEDAVNKQRELRNRASQWDDLAKQEKKLSLKMRDTSGANAKEIQKLEEETQKKREDLLDKTVDDIIQNLKELYDEQQETREAEIEYREAVLENKNLIEEATAIVENWESVEDAKTFFLEMDEEYINASGATLEQLLEDVENYYNEVQLYQEARLMDIEDFTQATTDEIVQLSESTSETLTSEADRAMREVTTSVNETIQAARDAVVQAINDVASAQEALRQAIANTAQAYRDLAEAQAAAGGSVGNTGGGNTSVGGVMALSSGNRYSVTDIANQVGISPEAVKSYLSSQGIHGAIGKDSNGKSWVYITDTDTQAANWITSTIPPQERNNWTAFAEGGLVPFTGPAWVDGTPDRPEAFLNPEDTRNIGNLIDVLRSLNFNSLISSMQTAFTPSVGDTHMEININIENVASDYDVDQAVERVRQDIIDISTAAGSTVILHK